MKFVPDEEDTTDQQLKFVPDDESIDSSKVKPKESFMSGMLKSTGHNILKQISNAAAFSGSEGNPISSFIAEKAKEAGIPIPADIASNFAKKMAGTIDETQPGTTTGNIIGDVVSSLPLSAAKVIPNAGLGAYHGFLDKEGSLKDRVSNAAQEGAAQAAGALLPAGLSSIIKGIKPSKNAVELMKMGVQPTVGQGAEQNLLGRSLRQIEEASTSIPFLGAIPKAARQRAVGEWDNAVLNKIEIPGLVSAGGKQGNEAIDNLHIGFSNAYDAALQGHTIPLKPKLINDLTTAINDTDRYIAPQDRNWAQGFLTKQFSSIPQTGSRYPADGVKHIESKISEKARQLNQTNPELSNLLNDSEGIISNYRAQHLPIDVSKGIKELDTKYAMFKRMQKASSMLGAEEGKFTPAGLLNAVKAMDKSKDKAQFGRGKALLQNIASHGKTVLSDTLGESGTAARTFVGNAGKVITGAGGGYAAATGNLPTAIAAGSILAGIGKLGSTRVAQKAFLGGYQKQKQLADLLGRFTQPSATVGYSLGKD